MFRFLLVTLLVAVCQGFALTPSVAASRSSLTASSVVMKSALRTNDMVKVLSGDDKGEVGKLLEVDLKKGMVVVEGVNIKTKHVKPMKEGESGSIVKKEQPIHISNVAISDAAAPAAAAAE